MPKVNPVKQFQYVIEVDGLDQFLCQELTLPDETIEEAEHTEGNAVYRTPGLTRIGDVTLSNLVPTDENDDWAKSWLLQVQDRQAGSGGTPEQYLRTVVVRLLDNGGNTIKTYEMIDCWVKQITGLTLSKSTSDNIMREVVLVVNDINEF